MLVCANRLPTATLPMPVTPLEFCGQPADPSVGLNPPQFGDPLDLIVRRATTRSLSNQPAGLWVECKEDPLPVGSCGY
jgi:hypothetical protein